MTTESDADRITSTGSAASAGHSFSCPLSHAQQGMYFLYQLQESSSAYHVPLAWRVNGALDVEALHAALNDVIARHEALRTRFESTPDGAVQIVEPALPIALPVLDLSVARNGDLSPEALR